MHRATVTRVSPAPPSAPTQVWVRGGRDLANGEELGPLPSRSFPAGLTAGALVLVEVLDGSGAHDPVIITRLGG